MQRSTHIKIRLTISLLVAMTFVSALFVRCASIESPTGGPKDSLPPVIIAMTPNNFSTNMDTLTRRVYIEFDEFVQIADQQKEFFTSPKLKSTPQLQTRGRGVVVTLRDTLKPNTTYALNFGSSIRDYNESNPLYSMRYVFSTGDTIDSLILSGYAEDSYKADSVSGTFILLYPQDSVQITAEYDSTLFNSTPAVIARAESNGIFMAQNLKPIPYHIYALEDNNSNLTYEPGVDRVGFIDGVHNPAELGDFSIWFDSIRKYVVAEPQLHFRMFMDEAFKRQLLSESSRPLQHKAMLNFSANHPKIDSLIFDSIPEDRVIYEYPTIGRDTITLWFDMPSEQLPDTIKGRVVYYKHDSINNLTLTSEPLKLAWRYIESKAEEQEREKQERARKRAEDKGEVWEEPEEVNKFKMNYSKDEKINPEKRLTFDFDYPLVKLDSSRVRLTRLTVEEQQLLEEQRKMQEDMARLAAAEAALAAHSEGAEAGGKAAAAAAEVKAYYGEPFPYKLWRDTQNIRRWYIDTDWGEEGDLYYLTIDKGALLDVAGLSNDSLTMRYTPMIKEQYTSIIVNIAEDKQVPSHYILELLDAAGKTVKERRESVTHGCVELNYLPVETYTLRVIQDINNNGKWDSGDLIYRRQSEKSKMYQSPKGIREIETKENWEIEISLDPSQMFAPETQADLVRRLEKEEQFRLDEIERKRLEKLNEF